MRALLGSVASAVARRTSRPVLLVPPEVWRRAIADNGAGAQSEPRWDETVAS
jgi:hypothetical protein